MSQEIRTVVAEGPSESAVSVGASPRHGRGERMRFASVSSEVMEEEGRGVAPGGRRGRPGRRGPEVKGEKRRKCKKVQGELMGCKASWQQFH